MDLFRVEKNIEKMTEVLNKVFGRFYIVIDGSEKDKFFKFLEEWKLPFKIELFDYKKIPSISEQDKFLKFLEEWKLPFKIEPFHYNKIHSIAVYYVPCKIYIRLRSNDNSKDSEVVINLLKLFIAGELDTIERVYQFTQKLSKEMGVKYEYIDEY